MTPPENQTSPEERGIEYLRDEITWHRKAGRLLFAFVVGAAASVGLIVREALAVELSTELRLLMDLAPATIPAALGIWGAYHFRMYYKRISRLKSRTQMIMGHLMKDPTVQAIWGLAFEEKPHQ